MRIQQFFSLLYFLGFISCSNKNEANVDKLLIIQIGNCLNYDSLGVPQLSLRTYVEYNKTDKINYANGSNCSAFVDFKVPSYSLDKFYKIKINDSIKEIINDSFVNKDYDSSYTKNDESEGCLYALIYQINGTTRQITYFPEYLPKELFLLDSLLRFQIKTNYKEPVVFFSVDSLLPNFEQYLFEIHPPPPSPKVSFCIQSKQ